MWKVIIADDEPKIRRGLKNALNWDEYEIEIVGEAEDGEVALKLASELMPDIMLVDINMPFLNGLELIKAIKETLEECIIIVITGYDEFKYAQEAVKLQVFDYLLKPVVKNDLISTVVKACSTLTDNKNKNKYIDWANKQLDENIHIATDSLFSKLLNGAISEYDLKEELKLLKMNFSGTNLIIMIKTINKLSANDLVSKWDSSLIYFAFNNIIRETLSDYEYITVFSDDEDNIITVLNMNDAKKYINAGNEIQSNIEKYLKIITAVCQTEISELIDLKNACGELLKQVNYKVNSKPIIILITNYMESHYYENDLTLDSIAKKFSISSSYLTKLLKQEVGISFIDFLTNTRIKKAIFLMKDPSIKLYEVAELIGYSNQYYFSNVFKRVMKLSPQEYRVGTGIINEII